MEPRQILPGSTYLVTRRCTQRQFLLRPCRRTNQIFAYCLAYAASRTGIQVHAVTVMSNHYHAVVTDPDGVLPAFVETLNKLVAKCMNVSYGRWENFWAGGEPTSYVRLVDADAILEKTVYTLANPVSSGLVCRSKQWPGLCLGRPGRYEVRRPKVFFRATGVMPEKLSLEVTLPPGESCPWTWAQIRRASLAREHDLRVEAQRDGRAFLGRRAARRQDPFRSPSTIAPRRALSPRVATRNRWLRLEALSRCREFVRRYREALRAWRAAERDVLFPAGTYGLRAWHGALCAPD